MKTRDLTRAQFQAALERHGMFGRDNFLGYVQVTSTSRGDLSNVNVCGANAGPNLRRQLAYLLAEQARVRRNDELERDAKQRERARLVIALAALGCVPVEHATASDLRASARALGIHGPWIDCEQGAR